MKEPHWHSLGPAQQFAGKPLQQLQIGELKIALSYHESETQIGK